LSVKIRLKRIGRKKSPVYKLVAIDEPSPQNGKEIEDLGRYNPLTEPALLDFQIERIQYWLSVGAQPTDATKRLLSQKGLLPKEVKVPKNPGVKKKDLKKAA